jgi:hypothetical protein
MKPLNVLLTWLATLLIGFVIISIVTGDLGTSSIFTLVAGVFSLPYVIVMLFAVNYVHSFWPLQVIHLVVASIIALIIIGMDESFFSELYWIVFCYFGIGFLVHLYWWFYWKPSKSTL